MFAGGCEAWSSLVEGLGRAGLKIRILFTGFLFGAEAVQELFGFSSVDSKVGAEFTTMAIEAIEGRFAGSLLGSDEGSIFGFFADLADGLAGLLVGLAGYSSGDLKAIKVDASLTAIEAVGAELAEDLIESDLDAACIFDRRKDQGLGGGSGDPGKSTGGSVVVAEGLAAEGRRLALVSAGLDVTAFFVHEISPTPHPPDSGCKVLSRLELGRGVAGKVFLELKLFAESSKYRG